MPLMSYKGTKGFSLVELLVVVAISGLVSTAIIGFFITQQRSHSAQEQVTMMQQNVRAAMGIMSKELRMAGYDTQDVFSTTAPIEAPGLAQITFKMNLVPNNVLTDVNEQIKYSLGGANGDTLLRQSPPAAAAQPIADSIQALAFAFAYDSDGDGALEPAANTYAIAGVDGAGPLDGSVNWYSVDNATGAKTLVEKPAGSGIPVPANAADIRAIKIWLLAKAASGDPNYNNNNTYVVGTQTITPNDNLRRLLLETVVRSRNMGL